jgi:hypothetical protein
MEARMAAGKLLDEMREIKSLDVLLPAREINRSG